MEELINKATDEQFENYLVKITDYNEDASKRDPLIKQLEINRPSKPIKPAASLNSSSYSSAASSTSSSSSTSSAASDSSTTSSSSTHSTTSSASSSPSQTQAKPQQQEKLATTNNDRGDSDKLEMAKLEDLGRTAKFYEHRQVPFVESAAKGHLKKLSNKVANAQPKSNTTSTNSNDDVVVASSQSTNKSSFNFSSTSNDNIEMDCIRKSLLLSQATSQKYAEINLQNLQHIAAMSTGVSSDVSWKTISGRRDKRKKKPAEKIFLTEHIPGHRGDTKVAIDDLVNYIESNGAPSKNKTKTPHNSKISTNNSSQKSNVNGANHTINSNSVTNSSITRKNNNIISINDANSSDNSKKTSSNVNISMNIKPQHTSSKMNNNIQPKKPPQRIQQSNQSQQNLKCEGSNKPNSQPIVQQRQQQQQKQTKTQSEPHQLQDNPPGQSFKETEQSSEDKSAAVVFADHIPIGDEVLNQYTFGFFEEQHNQTPSRSTDNIKSQQANINIRKQQSQQSFHDDRKLKVRQPKASPTTEDNRNKAKRDVDVVMNSFNYEQILKFISDSWAQVSN